ncbi:MAG: hypothetical protein ACJAYK_001268 [Crocinitomicaceae bacterium]|jgi:hypothetical protein
MKKNNSKILVGSLEICSLPNFNIEKLHIRVDTGATTSSLHVDNIEEFTLENEDWVRFDIHPDYHDVTKVVRKEAKVKDTKIIKSSNGTNQKRHFIETVFVLGDDSWPILLTLTDRSSMSYLMLLGRQAMKGRLIVDAEFEYLLGK